MGCRDRFDCDCVRHHSFSGISEDRGPRSKRGQLRGLFGFGLGFAWQQTERLRFSLAASLGAKILFPGCCDGRDRRLGSWAVPIANLKRLARNCESDDAFARCAIFADWSGMRSSGGFGRAPRWKQRTWHFATSSISCGAGHRRSGLSAILTGWYLPGCTVGTPAFWAL